MSAHSHTSLHGNFCYGGLLRGSVFPAKFLFVSLNTLPAEHETSDALVVVWSGERSTLRITERDSVQTERIFMRLVDTSSLDSRLHQSSKRVFAPVPSCCLCQCCTHNSLFLLSPYFAQHHWKGVALADCEESTRKSAEVPA